MMIGNGDSFGNMLMASKGICPNCGKILTFGDAALLARSHGIQDNVVACKGCGHVYQITLVPGKITLTNDVTGQYPVIKPDSAKASGSDSSVAKPMGHPVSLTKAGQAPAVTASAQPEEGAKKIGFFKAYKEYWNGYVDFTDRTSVRGYWFALLANVLVSFIVGFVLGILGQLSPTQDADAYVNAFTLLCTLPSLAIIVRRLRDAGSAWTNIFWMLLPIVGPVLLIVKLCRPSASPAPSDASAGRARGADLGQWRIPAAILLLWGILPGIVRIVFTASRGVELHLGLFWWLWEILEIALVVLLFIGKKNAGLPVSLGLLTLLSCRGLVLSPSIYNVLNVVGWITICLLAVIVISRKKSPPAILLYLPAILFLTSRIYSLIAIVRARASGFEPFDIVVFANGALWALAFFCVAKALAEEPQAQPASPVSAGGVTIAWPQQPQFQQTSAPTNVNAQAGTFSTATQRMASAVRPAASYTNANGVQHYKQLADQYAHLYSENLFVEDPRKKELKEQLLVGGATAQAGIADFLKYCGLGQAQYGWWNGAADLTRMLRKIGGMNAEADLRALKNLSTNIWEYRTQVIDTAEKELLELKKESGGYGIDGRIPAEYAHAELLHLQNVSPPEKRLEKFFAMQNSVDGWSNADKAFYYFIAGGAARVLYPANKSNLAFYAAQVFYDGSPTSMGWQHLRETEGSALPATRESAKQMHEKYPLPQSMEETKAYAYGLADAVQKHTF